MKSIGILGGGQLSRLLKERGQKLGLKVYVLSPSKEDPAAHHNPLWIKGDPRKVRDLKKILPLVDILTFESEFYSEKPIKKALDGIQKKVQIAPSLKNLSLIQDRLFQKKLLSQYKIPTSDFLKVSDRLLKTNPKKELKLLWDRLGPFVLKNRTGGYDGYGTFIIKRKSEIQKSKIPSGSYIAEKFVPFQRELAILVARNKKNQMVFYPLVETLQKNQRCLWVKGPVKHKKIQALKKQIQNFLKGIKYEGLMALELFDTKSGLLVNELAPRVHNSGHYSLDALSEDQFTTHLRAIRNQTLKPPRTLKKGFAMLNLLGEGVKKPFLKEGKGIPIKYLDKNTSFPLKILSGTVWWYGKSLSRKGRKMGHLNFHSSSPNKALNKLLKVRSFFKV